MKSVPVDLNLWLLPPLVSFLTLLVLTLVSVIKGKGHKLSLLFAAICMLGAFLSLDKALMAVLTDPLLALRSSRIDHMIVVFFVPLYLHFTVSFLKLRGKGWLIAAAYVFGGTLSLLSQSPSYIEGVTQYTFGYFPKGGPLIFLFGCVSSLNTLYCLYLLGKNLNQEKDPVKKNKTRYIILGLGGAALLAHVNFLPLTGVPLYPLGNLAFVPLLVLGFALLKHDVLDMGLALQKGLLYSLLTGLLTGGYALAIIFFDHIFKGTGFGGSVVFSLAFFFVIVFIFEPLKRRIQRGVDALIFRGKYDYQKTLRRLSEAMTSMLNLDEIIGKTLKTLTETIPLQWAYVMLRTDDGKHFVRRYERGKTPETSPVAITAGCPLFSELAPREQVVTMHAVLQWHEQSNQSRGLKEDFESLRATVAFPMMVKGRVNGLLVLGNKQSSDLFTARDLELLRTLASQFALAIENAKAYQTIEAMNTNLERIVGKRTAALRKALEAKEKAQDMLIRSESLAAVGALAAGVAHELNNPLASVYSLVQSSIETLEEDHLWTTIHGTAAEERDEMIDDLRFSLGELERARDIVASLLGISHQSQEYCEPVDVNAVVQDALKILSNKTKRTGLAVNERLGANLPNVSGNFANLGQVFLNIITNAIQALHGQSGTIVIQTRHDRSAGMVVFECKDSGPGISPVVKKDIFKPFFTTKAVGKGTGLGLYVCHEIIRKHGGSIRVQSDYPGGSVFCVALPVGGNG